MTVRGLEITGDVFCGILAAIHIYIFVLETFLWRSRAAKGFNLSQTVVDYSAGLAANQGFYNLLLAVGLIWSLAEQAPLTKIFFLSAIFTAGLFGFITASVRILFVQVIPSFLALIFVNFGYFPNLNNWSNWRHPLWTLMIIVGAGLITMALAFLIKKKLLNTNQQV
ncbi:unnamed protein product [Didymodactylos carnosus]|uniref:Uncharacterized protein n=1 Tax=Didymodactylos carnosus TaxID=1234261 RepID=A0A814B6E7_9BILA|nr:unnamed protein product [Didymodactylos carnosus]CAF3702699.1 unnamed protein product [Didymodactylos carnosus]